MILTFVEDLIFLAKIQQTAQMIRVPVEPADPKRLRECAAQPHVRAVIVDLNHRSLDAVDLIRGLKQGAKTRHIRVVGFLSHVQGDRAAAAREAGCDLVLARSAFHQQLPALLARLASGEPQVEQFP